MSFMVKDISRVNGANSFLTVDRDEVDRLRKRFMKLDKVRTGSRVHSLLALLIVHTG